LNAPTDQAKAMSPKPGLALTSLLPWGLFIALVGWNYWATLKWMVMRWEEHESYMAHGWLIAPISIFLAWRLRESLPLPGKGGYLALFGFAVSLLLHLISGLADVSSISGLTLIPLVFCFVWLEQGWARAKTFGFPIFFLVMMVPPPEFVISGINFTLKLLASDIACQMLNFTGLTAIRQGSFMLFGEHKLAIGDVCSGLRSLLALFALGVLYAYLVRDRGWKQVAAVLVATVPAAILGNGLRIGLVCYLVEWFGTDMVFKPLIGDWDLHLLTGAIIFITALAFLIGITKVIEMIWPEKSAT
jgi:exosortase